MYLRSSFPTGESGSSFVCQPCAAIDFVSDLAIVMGDRYKSCVVLQAAGLRAAGTKDGYCLLDWMDAHQGCGSGMAAHYQLWLECTGWKIENDESRIPFGVKKGMFYV